MGFLPSTVSSISFHFHDFQQGFPEESSIFSQGLGFHPLPKPTWIFLEIGGKSDPQVISGDVTDVISTPSPNPIDAYEAMF